MIFELLMTLQKFRGSGFAQRYKNINLSIEDDLK